MDTAKWPVRAKAISISFGVLSFAALISFKTSSDLAMKILPLQKAITVRQKRMTQVAHMRRTMTKFQM